MTSTLSRLLGRMLLSIILVVPAVVLGGVAAAYWTGSGSGTAAGATGTAVAVTLSAGSPAAALHPGAQTDVTLSVSNPNASPVRIGSLSLDTSHGFEFEGGHAETEGLSPSRQVITVPEHRHARDPPASETCGVRDLLSVLHERRRRVKSALESGRPAGDRRTSVRTTSGRVPALDGARDSGAGWWREPGFDRPQARPVRRGLARAVAFRPRCWDTVRVRSGRCAPEFGPPSSEPRFSL